MSRLSSSSGHTSIILVILLAGTVWSHRELMLKVEHIALTATFIIVVLIGLLWLMKFIKLVRRWRIRRHPAMVAIDQMSGLEFEKCVAGLLRKRGYAHIRITEKYDLGVDITAEKNGLRWGIQVKRYSGLVKADAVRQVVTAVKFYQCDKAMVITNSVFSGSAIKLADSNDCLLMDRTNLLRLIY